MYQSLFSRGLAGTILVYKIAGALAQQGGSLDEVYAMAQWVSSRIGTIGVGLEHCHVCLIFTVTRKNINIRLNAGTGNRKLGEPTDLDGT